MYYCDEPRRVDYEKKAARASNPLTRLPYAPMRYLQKADERASVAAAGVLLTNSAYTAETIQHAYGRSAQVVTPGIAEVFRPGPELDRTHLLSVGTLIPSKGHDLVLEAAAAAEVGLPVVVVAPREDGQEAQRLRTLANRLAVPLDIRVGISDAELATLYGSAFATLYLARDEPLGLVSLESQACGTPVVVTRGGGLVETVEDGVGGFHVTREPAAAATALRRMAEPVVWAALRAGALRRTIPRDHDSAAAVLRVLTELASQAS